MTEIERKTNGSSFELNGFLVGLVLFAVVFVTMGITIFSQITAVQDATMDMFSVKRGTTILIGALIGLILSMGSAVIFEKRARETA